SLESELSGSFAERVHGRTAPSKRACPARGSLDLALFIATEIAEALSGARTATTADGLLAGMAHLDLAAHQVLLSQHGEVKLTDFGLAGSNRWGSSVRSIRAIASRAAAMSPEIARGRVGDTRSDVFSLGV